MEKTVQIRIPKEIYDVLEFYKIDFGGDTHSGFYR